MSTLLQLSTTLRIEDNSNKRFFLSKGEYEVTKNNLMASKEALEAARLDTQTKRKQLAKSSEKLAKIEAMYKKLLRGAKPGQKRVDNVITAIKSVADKRRSVINE